MFNMIELESGEVFLYFKTMSLRYSAFKTIWNPIKRCLELDTFWIWAWDPVGFEDCLESNVVDFQLTFTI